MSKFNTNIMQNKLSFPSSVFYVNTDVFNNKSLDKLQKARVARYRVTRNCTIELYALNVQCIWTAIAQPWFLRSGRRHNMSVVAVVSTDIRLLLYAQ